MTIHIDERLITVAEAARLLQVSQSTIWRWIDSGKVPAYRIGERRIRLKESDLERLITPARGEKLEEMPALERPLVTRLTPEEQRRGIEALAVARFHAKALAASRGVERFPSSVELLHELRDERSKQRS